GRRVGRASVAAAGGAPRPGAPAGRRSLGRTARERLRSPAPSYPGAVTLNADAKGGRRRGEAYRRAGAAARRLRTGRGRHRAEARLPADGPDRNRREAAGAGALQPARAVRGLAARPPPLAAAEAV